MTNLLSPFVKTQGRETPPVAAGADAYTIVFRAPYPVTVSAVRYVPTGALIGSATARTFTLYNRNNGNGLGTLVVAQLAMINAVNLVDNVSKPITLATNPVLLELTTGDVIEWESLHVGAGVADPGGLVEIDYIRAD